MLQSGVHATVAGILVALFIPLKTDSTSGSPLERLEHGLEPWVVFLILPVFGFANAGVSLTGLTAEDLLSPVPVGVATGLFPGKQVGVLAFRCSLSVWGWPKTEKQLVAADIRRLCSVWNWFYHEPFHWQPCICGKPVTHR